MELQILDRIERLAPGLGIIDSPIPEVIGEGKRFRLIGQAIVKVSPFRRRLRLKRRRERRTIGCLDQSFHDSFPDSIEH